MAHAHFTVRQLFEMSACTDCQACADVCPAVSASRDGELSAVYRIRGLEKFVRGRSGFFRKIFGKKTCDAERWNHFSDTVFRCTLCGNCQEVCPVGIHLKELWISLRADLVQARYFPRKINKIRDNLEESHNVFGEDNEERAEWVEEMAGAPEDGYIREKAEVVYFAGCVAAYFPLAQKIPVALARILESSGVDFTLLGKDEWCCGFPLLGAGLKDMFQEFAAHNLDMVRKKGADKVVFACPSCYQMWREHYPQTVQLFHGTQFLLSLVKDKRIKLRDLPLTVTYHDPCDLGRGARVFEQPRELIRSIPGVRLVELADNREACACCGGGGNLEMIDAELSKEIAGRKIADVLATGAQAVVTSCQQCVRTMATFARRNKVPVEVLDITELVLKALKPVFPKGSGHPLSRE